MRRALGSSFDFSRCVLVERLEVEALLGVLSEKGDSYGEGEAAETAAGDEALVGVEG